MKKILIYSVLCLIAALPVSAQKFYKDAINITNASHGNRESRST